MVEVAYSWWAGSVPGRRSGKCGDSIRRSIFSRRRASISGELFSMKSTSRAGKREVDFIENNSPEMEALRREKMLLRMESPHFPDLRPGTLPAHHEYATSTMDVFVQAYNTEKVKRDELPKTFQDLLDP